MTLLYRAAGYTCSNSRSAQQFEMRSWSTEYLPKKKAVQVHNKWQKSRKCSLVTPDIATLHT